MKKLLIVANLRSGRGIISNCFAEMIDYYNSKGFEVTAYSSQYSGHIKDIVEKTGSDYDNIVCCGGDGTLNEAINGLMCLKKRPLLGYIPCGSTNDFASSTGIPSDIRDGFMTAVGGNRFSIDIGELNGRYFSYVAGFGAFTNISYETPQTIKNMLGYQAYLLMGLKEIGNIKAYPVKISYDDKVIEDEVILGLVSNSNSIGGIKVLSGNYAELNDGLFEVFLIKKPHNMNILVDLINCISEKNFDNDLFHIFKTDHIKIESPEYIKWTVDGEYGGDFNLTEINVMGHAVDIMVKR